MNKYETLLKSKMDESSFKKITALNNDKVMDFVDKMLVSDTITGAVDLTVEDISTFGPVSDPSGKMFHGCDIAFRILEFEP